MSFHVLHVEDDATDAGMFQSWLRDTRFRDAQVTTVPTLKAALSLCDSYQFDILVVDLGLPDSIGTDHALETLSSHFDGPVIGLTNSDLELARSVARRVGVPVVDKYSMVSYQKEVRSQPLLEAIQAAVMVARARATRKMSA